MALNKRPDVPATSRPSFCAINVDEGKCGKPAHIIFEGVVEIMGKEVKVKKLICDEHYEILRDRNDSYSTNG